MEDKERNAFKSILKANTFTLIAVLIAVLVVFTVLNRNYISMQNALNILYAASIMGLLAIGTTYLLIGGHVDLGLGSAGALAGVSIAMYLNAGIPWVPALLLVLATGAVIGLFNAALVNVFGLQPFIATLASASVVEGIAYLICGGRSVAISDKSFIYLGTGRVVGIPIPVIILVVLFIVFGLILARTKFGRSIYMIGGNATAARLAGLNPKRISTVLYVLASAIASLGGAILAARMHSGAPTAVHGAQFDAITAAVLGGVAFGGGVGTMTGTFVGLLILNCFNNGLTVVNVSSFWQIVARGALLIVALIIDYFRRASAAKQIK